MEIGEEREKGIETIFKAIMTTNFSQINVGQQTTNPGSSKNTKQDKYQKNYTQSYHIQTSENQRKRKNLERSQRKETTYL